MREFILQAPDPIKQTKDEITVDFTGMRPEVVVAELCLAHHEPLKIRGAKADPYVVIQRVPGWEGNSTVTLEKSGGTFTLAMRDMMSWEGFFARFYRDGMAEVDHIHLECKRPGTNVSFDLTPQVREPVRPPMTREEFERWVDANGGPSE